MIKNSLPVSFTALRCLAVVLVLAMAFLPSGANASPDTGQIELTSEERTWLKQHPVIRVHNEKDWPPFNYFEYGSPGGCPVDYMDLVAATAGHAKSTTCHRAPAGTNFLGWSSAKSWM